MHTKIVIVEKYQKTWKEWFESIKEILQSILKDLVWDIIHVGSTSIPGLKSKPIIDIDIVAKKSEYPQIIAKLQDLGYIHQGNLGIEGREAFSLQNTQLYSKLPRHHLYLCYPESNGLKDHLYLKEFLKIHPEFVQRYGDLKENLARLYLNDIDRYMEGKNSLIKLMIAQAHKEIHLDQLYDFYK